MKKIILSLLASLLLSGCGTIAARISHQNVPDVPVYPATAVDASGFYLACCTNLIHMEGTQPIGTTIAFRTIVPIFMIIDAPISLATDTVLLPYDLYKSGVSNDKEDGPDKKPSGDLPHRNPDKENK